MTSSINARRAGDMPADSGETCGIRACPSIKTAGRSRAAGTVLVVTTAEPVNGGAFPAVVEKAEPRRAGAPRSREGARSYADESGRECDESEVHLPGGRARPSFVA